jgi:hypothetical protein
MKKVMNSLLITLVLLTVIATIPVGTATAGPSPSSIAEDYEPRVGPIGRYSGEPDVGGSTSPATIGRTQSQAAGQSQMQLNDVVRIAVWLWKSRFGMTGF